MKILSSTLLALCFMSCSAQQNNDSLTMVQANEYSDTFYKTELSNFVDSYANEVKEGVLSNGDYSMKFWVATNGEKPNQGYPLYISMHGGGGTEPAANDQQWENQKRLYGVVPGIYFVPRSPTDSWNMWHQEYMEGFLLKIVSYCVEELGADPKRIYLTGYSAGGDGTFNLAPRLSDRFGAAAMMAGHPGDAVAENLRNLPFAIYMGGLDDAYNRNGLAAEWGLLLDSLQNVDPTGYIHRTVIYPEKGHWMDNEDKEAIGWMAQFTRNAAPDRVIWIQDDVLATRKYNLEVKEPVVGNELRVCYYSNENRVDVEKCDYSSFRIWLNDAILNLDKTVKVTKGEDVLFEGMVERTKANIEESVRGRYDRDYAFSGVIDISLGEF